MLTLLAFAARNALQHRRRSLLMGGAITAVTLLLTLALGVLNATGAQLRQTAVALFAGDLNVNGLFKPSFARALPVLDGAQATTALIQAELPEAEVVPRWFGLTGVASHAASIQSITAIGVDLEADRHLPLALRLVSGSLEGLARPGAVVLSVERARKLQVSVGDEVTLTALNHRRSYDAVDATVAAIAENVSGGLLDWVMFTSRATVKELFGFGPDEVSTLQVHLPGGAADLLERQERLRLALERGGHASLDVLREPWAFKKLRLEADSWTGRRVEVTRWDEEVPLQSETLGLLGALVGALGFVLMLVASMGLMNSLWLAVRERTPEIGTLRALGMHRRQVVGVFLAESFLIAAAGAAAGTGLGWVAGVAVNGLGVGVPSALQLMIGMGGQLRFELDPGASLVVGVLVTLSTTVVSVFPSYLASRISPVVAMGRAG